MNCPTCGAQNEADARFCAECGTPLENQEIEAAKAEQVFDDSDEDKTILSSPADLAAEQAKTLTVDEAKLAAALDEGEEAAPASQPSPSPETPASEPELEPEPAGPGSGSGGESGGADSSGGESGGNRKMIIIGAVVLLLLFCCCCSVAIGGAIGSDPDAFEDILRDLTALPVSLLLV